MLMTSYQLGLSLRLRESPVQSAARCFRWPCGFEDPCRGHRPLRGREVIDPDREVAPVACAGSDDSGEVSTPRDLGDPKEQTKKDDYY